MGLRWLCILGLFAALHASHAQQVIPLDSLEANSNKILPYFNKDNRLIISGETHGVTASNDDKILKLFVFLHQHQLVDCILWEAGVAYNYYVETFLQTGDTSLLVHLTAKERLHRAPLFEALYAYNQTLPTERRIKSVSIDVDFWDAYEYPIGCLQFMLNRHGSLPVWNNRLQKLTPAKKKVFTNQIDSLLHLATQEKHTLEQFLREDYAPFIQLLQRLYKSAYIMSKGVLGFKRERMLTDHFEQQVIKPGYKAFAQFGDAHLPSSDLYNPFTKRIQSRVQTPISEVHSLYIQCHSNYGYNLKYSYSTAKDPLRNYPETKAKLSASKGNWLVIIDEPGKNPLLLIVSANDK